MPLEKWQKYSKADPCPVCAGFNSGRKNAGTLCKGFRHADKQHVFCQRITAPTLTNINGLVLYKHSVEDTSGGKVESKPARVRQVPKSHNYETIIVEQEQTYEGQKQWGVEIPPFTLKWYVVMRDGREVTRDLSEERARLFLND